MSAAVLSSCRLLCSLQRNNRLTFNEPWCSAVLGYGNGEHAPGRVSESAAEVYRAGHNMLLAHARAVDIYRAKFQSSQNGVVGITLNANWTGRTRAVLVAHGPVDDYGPYLFVLFIMSRFSSGTQAGVRLLKCY